MKRNRIVLAALLVLVSAFALVRSRASSLPMTPPGVPPEAWYPISDRLGIVLRDEPYSGRSELYGTFMVREGSSWRRVVIAPGPGIVPAR